MVVFKPLDPKRANLLLPRPLYLKIIYDTKGLANLTRARSGFCVRTILGTGSEIPENYALDFLYCECMFK